MLIINKVKRRDKKFEQPCAYRKATPGVFAVRDFAVFSSTGLLLAHITI